MLFVYVVPLNVLLTYPVEEKHQIKDVMKALYRETNIPIEEMDLVYAGGVPISISSKAKEFAGVVCMLSFVLPFVTNWKTTKSWDGELQKLVWNHIMQLYKPGKFVNENIILTWYLVDF